MKISQNNEQSGNANQQVDVDMFKQNPIEEHGRGDGKIAHRADNVAQQVGEI